MHLKFTKPIERLHAVDSTEVKKRVRQRGSTKKEQREASVDAILSSALKLFAEKGYRSTTVDEIAAACALTKGAVYFYFPNKAAILFALFDEIEELMVGKMVSRVEQAGPRVTDKLVALIHNQSETGLENAERLMLFILMLLEFNGAGDDVEARVKSIYKRYHTAIENIIRQGKSNGEFRDDIDARSIAGVIMAIINGSMMEWYCRADEHNGRELARAGRIIAISGVLNVKGQ